MATNVLQEHEVRAERFLRGVRVFDVPLSRLPSFSLRSTECVLALNILRGQRALPGSDFTFSLLLRCLRSAFKRLEMEKCAQ